MADHLFISYSSVDGFDFSLNLADQLAAGPPPIPVWIDKRNLHSGANWDEQIVEGIKTCKGMIFVMTKDSVDDLSVCKSEWVRALRYKKPIIPLLLNREAELPFSLGSREYIDFTSSFDTALARLRIDLKWMDSPEGQLQALKYRQSDAQRELRRSGQEQQTRILEDIAELKQQIEQQQEIINNPLAAKKRVQETIERGLERERQPTKPVSGITQGKFINPPPLDAPKWFQDRHVETGLVGEFLKDDALRLIIVVGRGGVGKSAMVSRLLRSLEGGQLPDEGGAMTVDGIVYLSDARSLHRVNVPDLYSSLTKLLSEETNKYLDSLYKNPQTKTREIIQALLESFTAGRTVVLLDNFEDEIDIETGKIKDAEINEALRALLELPPHRLKVIITTRIFPGELALIEPGRQRRLDLDNGLESPYAEFVLRAMDPDGKVGLRDAPEALLTQAQERTRGYPRALEHLFGILSADRNTSLIEILENTKQLLPEQVMNVLVGEAFSRLDVTAQLVMQALAVYRYPIPSAAVDYLLQPYMPAVNSGPVLSRLVNMQFVRRDAGRHYLHQIDQTYAISRIPAGVPGDREANPPPLSHFALKNRAAEWFKLARKPRETWKTLDDLAPQLSEFEMRCFGEDYDTAAGVLLEFDFDYLLLWGHYLLMIQLHERLQDKITDPLLKQNSEGNLGSAYFNMGHYQRALDCYVRTLVESQEIKDRNGEVAWLGNIGACYSMLGQIKKAIEYCDRALVIRREIGDRIGERLDLSNLGLGYAELGQISRAMDYLNQALALDRVIRSRYGESVDLFSLGTLYADLGQTTEAFQYYRDAIAIAQEIGYRLGEAETMTEIGYIYLYQDKWDESSGQFKEAIEIADNLGNPDIQQRARIGLAITNLNQGELGSAIEMAGEARKFDCPLSNYKASFLSGIVMLRKGDILAVRDAFSTSVRQSTELIRLTPEYYQALDIQGLAYCGLILCGDSAHIPAAKAAFRNARSINADIGIRARALYLFDQLGKADPNGILSSIREEVTGKI
ncbi:MAG: tetratricopeptide repeat protein [Ferruginibacter sp.]